MAHYSSLTVFLGALALTSCGGGSTAVDLAPTFSSGTTFTVAEGSADVATIAASDPEGRAVRYSLVNGEDSALFSLSSQGQLRFLQAPDYETPLDLTANNRYSLGVTASDGGNSTALTLTVNVTDALEGRVVDGPLAGSLVFRDLDEDFELDTGEPQTTTDSDGFFLLDDSEVNCDQLNSCGLNVVAYGGTDTSTNTLLSDFVLAGQLQRNQDFIISPISTLLTGTDDAVRLLSGLQLSVSPEQLALLDPWQLAENNQGSLLARNQQIGLLVQTLITVLSVDAAVTPLQVTLELVSVISGLVDSGDLDLHLDLGDELLVTEILNNALAGFPSSSALDTEALAAVGGKLAMINRSLVEIQEDLTADFAVAVVRAAQTDLQRSVAALSGNEISVEQFLQATAAEALFADVPENLDLANTDGDDLADFLDQDDDNDLVLDRVDWLPLDPSEWVDSDGDEIGDNADPDDDNDSVVDTVDAFPFDAAEFLDTDGDRQGNNGDLDDDNDSVADGDDAFPLDADESVDTDGDSIGNNADPDDDNDAVLDEADAFPLDASESLDTDGDGIGNNADLDDDGDGHMDGNDALPLDVSEWLDTDGDEIGNNSDPDDDNDNVADVDDALPLDPGESVDTDGDNIGNNADPDDDNDAVLDGTDAFPLDASEWLDTDGDDIGNNADPDDDNDNVADVDDALPLDSTESVDTDGDEVGNNSDPDDDGDGYMDGNDAFPLDGSEWLDTDGDEIGNNADPDDDNDSVVDGDDAFPLDASESLDTDGDEIGNNADSDDDGDGVNDLRDDAPLDASITPPTALFYADQLQGSAPLIVLFDASDTVAGYVDDTVVSFSWDFADGSSGSGISVSHAFESTGTFPVVLTVLNSDGLSDVFTESVMVTPGSYSVSGVISVADSARSDSDVNDLASTFVINSSFSRAQLLDVPANVIGYVNTANYGPSGKTFSAGDPRDYYQFEALGGEVINLILDSPGGTAAGYTDLDMYLYDADNDLVGYSIGETQYESLMIPLAQGTYYLRVNVWTSSEGAGKYYLSIGAGLTSLGSGWSSDTEFAVGDVIVKERPSKTRSVSNIARAAATPSAVRSMGRSGPKLYRYGQNIGRQSDSRQSPGLTKGARSASLTAPSEIDMQVATLLAAKELSLDPAVEYAEPNFLRRSTQIPTDERYGIQWHYEQIRLPEAWDITTGSADVKVAVLDTGIFIAHPDLEARLSDDGFDFINNAYNAGDGEEVNEDSNGNGLLDPGEDLDGDGYLDDGQEIDNDANDPGDGADNPYCSESIGSSSFHGTHVAGTIGAETNNDDDSEDINGNGIIDLGEDIDSDGIIDTAGDGVGNGIAGVTWAGEIMNLRVLGCEGGYDFDIANAIRYAAGLENQSGIIVEDPADIANMSLGGGGTSLTLTRAIADATEAGLIIIAAAGNSATELPSYPAAYSNVISVSATLDDDSLASYSNYGATVDVSAPGSKIKSTLAEFNLYEQKMKASYASYNGTSMAAPHVAGVVSLMKSVYPQMSPSEFDAILLSGEITLDLGEAGRDDLFGAGRIDAAKAVEFVKALADGMRVIPVTPVLYLDKSYLNYGKTIGQYSINASNFGNGNLEISSVSAADAFVTVSGPQENAGIYTYTVGIDRSDLADGIYSSTVSFTSNGGGVDVSLVFQVMSSNLSSEGNLGNISVILKDINSGAEIPLQIQSAAAGQYSYSIDGVEQGVYEIHSGTDIDNDGVICGIAEACGAYPTLMSPTTVIVNGNVENLDFSLEIDGSAYSE